jgi:hypothetical protein
MIVKTYSGNRLVIARKRRHLFTTGHLFPKTRFLFPSDVTGNAFPSYVVTAAQTDSSFTLKWQFPFFFTDSLTDALAVADRINNWLGNPPPNGALGRAWNEYYAQFVGDKWTPAQYSAWASGSDQASVWRARMCVPLLPGFP